MTTFDDRESAFENKFAHDQEIAFKVTARRNKLFGLHIAHKLGKQGDAAEAYAKEVVLSDLQEKGDEDILGKALADLQAAGIASDIKELRKELNHFFEEAKKQIAG